MCVCEAVAILAHIEWLRFSITDMADVVYQFIMSNGQDTRISRCSRQLLRASAVEAGVPADPDVARMARLYAQANWAQGALKEGSHDCRTSGDGSDVTAVAGSSRDESRCYPGRSELEEVYPGGDRSSVMTKKLSSYEAGNKVHVHVQLPFEQLKLVRLTVVGDAWTNSLVEGPHDRPLQHRVPDDAGMLMAREWYWRMQFDLASDAPFDPVQLSASPEVSSDVLHLPDAISRELETGKLVLFDLNGTLLCRCRPGQCVPDARVRCVATEFSNGGSSARPYWMYHRPGIASMLASLVALGVEWGFWTNQVAGNAVSSIRVLLAQAITADVQLVPTSPREVELFGQRFQEARLLVQTETLSECIWAFDQAYCMDDPGGEVYPNTGRPIQVYNLAAVAATCGRAPSDILVVSAARKKCSSLPPASWLQCVPFDECAVRNDTEMA